jgi:anti-sigma-K factor RskA
VEEDELASAESAEQELDRDPALAQAVGAARDRLLPLDLAVDPVTPAAGTWDAIATRVASLTPAGEASPPVPPSSPVPSAPANVDRAPRGLLAALLAVAAAIVVGAFLAWTLLGPGNPLAVAVLQAEDGTAVALVEDFGGGDVALTPLAAATVGEGESLQVWTKWSEEAGPVSVGLLQDLRHADFRVPALPDPVAGQLYEITREPLGGSPTGLPTGPILALGRAVDR